MPLISKNIRINLYQNPSSSSSLNSPRWMIFRVAHRAKKSEIVHVICKLVEDIFFFIGHFEEIPFAGEVIKTITSISGCVNVIGSLAGLERIIEGKPKPKNSSRSHHEKNLKTAIKIISLINLSLSIVKILDLLEILKMSEVIEIVGRIPVVGSTLVTTAPFNAALVSAQLVRTILEITILLFEFHRASKEVEKARNKIILWQTPLTYEGIKGKREKIYIKQLNVKADFYTIEEKINKMGNQLLILKAKQDHKKNKIIQKKNITRIHAKISHKTTSFQLKRSYNAYLSLCSESDLLIQRYDHLEKKSARWKALATKINKGTLSRQEKKSLETLQNRKVEMWKTKKKNFCNKRKSIAFQIALKTALAAAFLTILVMTFSSPWTTTSIISISTAFVLISLGTTALHYHKRRQKTLIPIEAKTPLVTKRHQIAR